MRRHCPLPNLNERNRYFNRRNFRISMILTFGLLYAAAAISLLYYGFCPSPSTIEIPKIRGAIAGLILARGGSKGVPLKNLAKVDGESLVRRAIKTAKESGVFDSVWVSTDSEDIAVEALVSGAKVFWRSVDHASDDASSTEAVKEFLIANENVKKLGLIQCTSPFLPASALEKAAAMMNSGYDSVFSATTSHALRWKLVEGTKLVEANFVAEERPRRQSWDGEFVENGMFYFFNRDGVLTHNSFQHGRLGIVNIPKYRSVEIDSLLDLELAEIMNEWIKSVPDFAQPGAVSGGFRSVRNVTRASSFIPHYITLFLRETIGRYFSSGGDGADESVWHEQNYTGDVSETNENENRALVKVAGMNPNYDPKNRRKVIPTFMESELFSDNYWPMHKKRMRLPTIIFQVEEETCKETVLADGSSGWNPECVEGTYVREAYMMAKIVEMMELKIRQNLFFYDDLEDEDDQKYVAKVFDVPEE